MAPHDIQTMFFLVLPANDILSKVYQGENITGRAGLRFMKFETITI